MLLLTINRALPVVGIPDFWQRAVVGALIIGAIALDRVLAHRRSRRLAAARDADPPGPRSPDAAAARTVRRRGPNDREEATA